MSQLTVNSIETANYFFKRGNVLQQANRLDEAILAYQRAIELAPDSANFHHNLGNTLIKQHRLEEAVACYQTAIQLKPKFSTAYYRLGEVLELQHCYQEAIVAYQQALQLNPGAYNYLYRLGEVFRKQGNWQEAINLYTQAIELNPSLANAYYQIEELRSKHEFLLQSTSSSVQLASRLTIPEFSTHSKFDRSNLKKHQISILFLLPVKGGSGGAHSIMQECLELHRAGIQAKIAVDRPNYSRFLQHYVDIADAAEIVISYQTLAELQQLADQFLVVCATIYSSVKILEQLVTRNPAIFPAYYIQDYEPLFFNQNSLQWREAWCSYGRLSSAILFAKTHWLCKVVNQNHSVTVQKVEPSLDHQIYYPSPKSPATRSQDLLHVAAMVRFSTIRRAPKRTLRIIYKLSQLFSTQVKFTIFGATQDEIAANGMPLSQGMTVLGSLNRPEVAAVLREADIFLDLSDYQAFGRTALEAMACGCIPVVPQRGGTDEFAVDRENAVVIDTTSDEECFNRLLELLRTDRQELLRLRLNAIETAARYSKQRAALSILSLFHRSLTCRELAHFTTVQPSPIAHTNFVDEPVAASDRSPQIVERSSNNDSLLDEIKLRLLLRRKWAYLRYLHQRQAFLLTKDVETVLSIGCGLGLAELALALEFPDVQFHLTDFDTTRLTMAQQIVKQWSLPNVTFGRFDALSTPKNRYDLVASVEVLEHIQDDLLAIDNMCLSSKKYVFALVPFAPPHIKADTKLQEYAWRKFEHYRYGYSADDLDCIFTDLGQEVMCIQGCYWQDAGFQLRQNNAKLTDDEIRSQFPHLIQFADKDLYPGVPDSLAQASGIWTLVKI
jgi:glycosyltransferase involved in cell wall biosynthesis/SAM-dependent methyltransferase